MKKRIFGLVLFIGVFVNVSAQLSTKEKPFSFRDEYKDAISVKEVDKKIMPEVNVEKLIEEDESPDSIIKPYRFGYIHPVDFNLKNSGIWQTLSNGDKIWHLTIQCPKAKSINLVYDRFWIPEGGKFFIYTADKKQSIGAFTSHNNKSDKDNVSSFATELLFADEIVLEYYQPNNVEEDAIISVSKVIHGYRSFDPNLLPYNTSCNNQVNVNCSEGDNWQAEKRAITFIVNENDFCSGALINTKLNDNRPYVLTANHCLHGKDAITNYDLNTWIFYWNWESNTCSSPIILDLNRFSTSGATVIANNPDSDFALLELAEDPQEESDSLYYLGWDCSGNTGTGGVCIHHPKGDVKKIATYEMSPTSCIYSNIYCWDVHFVETINGFGITEDASSGSPLLNNNHRIIGQLAKGYGYCNNPSNSPSYFGKFSTSWTGNGNTDSRRRLKDWLNPNNNYVQTLDGCAPIYSSFSISGSSIVIDSKLYSINNLPSSLSVTWSINNSDFSISTIGNQCYVTYEGYYNIDSAVLTATIYRNGTVLKTVTKEIIHLYGIIGNPVLCNQNYYYVGLPNNYSVSWSINNNSFSLTPLGYNCRLTCDSYNIERSATLTATISRNGTTIGSISKRVFTHGTSLSITGTQDEYTNPSGWYYPEQSISYSASNAGSGFVSDTIYINKDCDINLSSSRFNGMDIYFSGSYLPSHITHNEDVVSFHTASASTAYDMRLQARDNNSCSDFDLIFKVTSVPYTNSPQLQLSVSNNFLYVHLMDAVSTPIGGGQFQQPTWTLKIVNMQGMIMTMQNVTGSDATVNISSYSPGMYGVTAIYNGQKYSAKFIK